MGKTAIGRYMAAEKKCALCNSSEQNELFYGEFLSTDAMAVHTFCLYLTSNLMQNGEDDEDFYGFLVDDIKKEAKRIRPLRCSYCGKPQANIGCGLRKCPRVYHLICGLKHNVEYQFIHSFTSHCHRHAQKSNELPKKDDICFICYEKLNGAKSLKPNATVPAYGMQPLRASCCRNGWFHKVCLQKCANTAGYFFKCPLCNDAKTFREQIQYQGIFIPNRDAAWELEPHAYDELLERPRICAAKRCRMRNARKATQDNFIYCDTCGSVAVHSCCLSEKTDNFNCDDCGNILAASGKVNNNNNSNSNSNNEETDDDKDNGTDVDVDVCALDDAATITNAITSPTTSCSSTTSTLTHSTLSRRPKTAHEDLKNVSCIASRTRRSLRILSPIRSSPKATVTTTTTTTTTITNDIVETENKSKACRHLSTDSADSSDSDIPIRLFHKRPRCLSSSSSEDDTMSAAADVTPTISNAATVKEMNADKNAQTQVAPIASTSTVARMATPTSLDSDNSDDNDDDPLNNIPLLLEMQNREIHMRSMKSTIECIVISDSCDSDYEEALTDCNKENENQHENKHKHADLAQHNANITNNKNQQSTSAMHDANNKNDSLVSQQPMRPFDISCIANRTRRRSLLRKPERADAKLTAPTTSQSNGNSNRHRITTINNLRTRTNSFKRFDASPSILAAKRARQQQEQQQQLDNVNAKTNVNMNTPQHNIGPILSTCNLEAYMEPSFQRINGKLRRINSYSAPATSSILPHSFRNNCNTFTASSFCNIQKQNSL